MKEIAVTKQVENYLPLLSYKQQTLVLELIKSFLNIDSETMPVSQKQYNKELMDAMSRVERGNFVDHEDAIKEL